jgi:RND family efflux transporter MFP subunit
MAVVLIVAAAAAVAAVAARNQSARKSADDEAPDIPTLAAKHGDVQVVVREIGTIEPEVKVDIKSNLSGRVVDLPVRAGDEVAKGSLIARIEPDVNQAQNLLSVKNQQHEARIDLEDTRQDYEAKKGLRDSGLISAELFRQAETRFLQAQQSLDAASEKITVVEASGIPVGDNPRQVVNIVSPMAGVVIVRPVELGETVTGSGSFNAGTVIATVADLATMLVKAGVNEVDIGKVHVGQPVDVTLDAYPRTVFPGTIERIAPAARLDNQVKVFDLEIALEHLGVELRTGMTANIEIRGESRSGVLTVPVETVFVRGYEEVVYVKRTTPLPAEAPEEATDAAAGVAAAATPAGSTEVLPADWRDDPRQAWRRWFEERPVVTGVASTTDVEVTEGLAEGEPVALADPTRPPEEEQ